MMADDVNYYRQRATEERRAALASHSPQVRKIHLEMAHRYEGSIRQKIGFPRRSPQDVERSSSIASRQDAGTIKQTSISTANES